MKELKRGYVKWVDEDGTFHKEPAYLHPEMLADASEKEKQHAENVRELMIDAVGDRDAVITITKPLNPKDEHDQGLLELREETQDL